MGKSRPGDIPTTLDTCQAYMIGFFSYREKIDEADNPYMFGDESYWQWRRGWYAAKKEAKPPWWKDYELLAVVILGVYALTLAVVNIVGVQVGALEMLLVAIYSAASVMFRLANKPVPSYMPAPLLKRMANVRRESEQPEPARQAERPAE